VDELAQFAHLKSEKDRDAYLSDVCQPFADLQPKHTLQLLHGRFEDTDTRAGSARIGALLAAVAAVGNAEAVEYYLARGGELISYNQLTNDGYNRPIEAAASTGKTLIVRRLLDIVDPRFSSVTVLRRHDSFVSLQEAARLAGKAGDAESAYLLLNFIKIKAPEQLGKEMFDRTKSFLVRAANSGCLRFVRLVRDAEGPATGPDPYRNALLSAWRAGHTEIVQYFF
jgi:hypothetical protein